MIKDIHSLAKDPYVRQDRLEMIEQIHNFLKRLSGVSCLQNI